MSDIMYGRPTIEDLEPGDFHGAYRHLYEGLADFIDPETHVLDYASDESRAVLGTIDYVLDQKGFERDEVKVLIGFTLGDVRHIRRYIDYLEEPGDLFTHA
jgi:hypothetical protein